jgi:hypothetical protein
MRRGMDLTSSAKCIYMCGASIVGPSPIFFPTSLKLSNFPISKTKLQNPKPHISNAAMAGFIRASKVRSDELKFFNTPDIDLPRLFQTNSDVMYRFDSPEVGVAVWPVEIEWR